MTPAPVAISTEALSLINNLVLDVRTASQAANTAEINEGYAAAHQTKLDLCEYIAKLEAKCNIDRFQTVKR